MDYFLCKNFMQIQSKWHPTSFTLPFIRDGLAGRLSFAFTSVCCKTLILIAEFSSVALVRVLAIKLSPRYRKKHSTFLANLLI